MAEVVDDVLLNPIESVLDSVGLMEGQLAPLKRATVGAVIGAGLVFVIKPKLAFTTDGNLRPWAAVSDDPTATTIPWWAMVAVPVVILGILI